MMDRAIWSYHYSSRNLIRINRVWNKQVSSNIATKAIDIRSSILVGSCHRKMNRLHQPGSACLVRSSLQQILIRWTGLGNRKLKVYVCKVGSCT
ncbi:hypothetical protein D1872_219860 [compost metagenome]